MPLPSLSRPALAAQDDSAAAQDTGAAGQGADNPPIDFVMRPSQDIDQEPESEDDIWNWGDGEPGPSMLETPIGPPLLGPTGEEPIGPPLAGPEAPPLTVRQRLKRITEESDPFAAIGVRLGAFVIRPSIEIGVTATNNVSGTENGKGAVGLVVTPEIDVRSESDRHEFEADLSAEGIFYEEDQFDERTANARVTGRYDLTDQTSLKGEAGYARTQESFTDDNTPTGAAEHPVVDSYDATLGVEQRFGRFTADLSGFADRSIYQDVPLVGGGTVSRKGEDNTEFGGRLRTGYTLGAGVTPFTEVAIGRRAFDLSVDADGFQRSSLWGELLGGVVIDRGTKLSGEASLGFHHEELEDDRLPAMDAVLANAAILWSPLRLTELRFDLSTDVQTTSVPDESGSVLYSSLVTLSRQITPRVKLSGGGGIDYEYSIGGDWHDVTFNGFAEASYAFNRTASVIARYDYERVESTQPGDDSEAHTVVVRLRLQR